jgi:transcriptional regulator with XRE-family HTH domain
MQSETITQGLKRYSIGQKLRRLRLRKSMGLSEVSKHTGLSPSLLSKLERDLMHPTLPTLLRIAFVFSVGLEYFFNSEPKPVLEIVRKRERLRFPEKSGTRHPAYHFESLDFLAENRRGQLNCLYRRYRPGGACGIDKADRDGADESTAQACDHGSNTGGFDRRTARERQCHSHRRRCHNRSRATQ